MEEMLPRKRGYIETVHHVQPLQNICMLQFDVLIRFYAFWRERQDGETTWTGYIYLKHFITISQKC